MTRIALFGGNWRLTLNCLQALLGAGYAILFITPPVSFTTGLRRFVGRNPLSAEGIARRASVPIVRYAGDADCEAALRRFQPDLICIVTFPRLIPARIAAAAPMGAINVHPSLLPRHRGTLPFFWTYYHGDDDAGVTIHRATDRFDAGPIIIQQRVPLPRGYGADLLARDLIARSGPLLLTAIEAVRAGAPETQQDESRATRAPMIDFEAPWTPFQEWDVERVWHFLAGMVCRYREPLIDDYGETVRYSAVSPFRRAQTGPVGLAVRSGDGWTLHCLNGTMDLRR